MTRLMRWVNAGPKACSSQNRSPLRLRSGLRRFAPQPNMSLARDDKVNEVCECRPKGLLHPTHTSKPNRINHRGGDSLLSRRLTEAARIQEQRNTPECSGVLNEAANTSSAGPARLAAKVHRCW